MERNNDFVYRLKVAVNKAKETYQDVQEEYFKEKDFFREVKDKKDWCDVYASFGEDTSFGRVDVTGGSGAKPFMVGVKLTPEIKRHIDVLRSLILVGNSVRPNHNGEVYDITMTLNDFVVVGLDDKPQRGELTIKGALLEFSFKDRNGVVYSFLLTRNAMLTRDERILADRVSTYYEERVFLESFNSVVTQ